ncbi:MAG: flavin reductase family protein, partial [Anaerolineae bacterium]|nr:flavin reductase family protein [Anaerolineae bacterium]
MTISLRICIHRVENENKIQLLIMPPPDKNHTDADLSDLRAAMRRWATGVSIVSTKLDESIHGMTVNSFTSISIDPALITVALEKTTRTHEMIMQSRIFGVTILTGEQQDISDRFAGRLPD